MNETEITSILLDACIKVFESNGISVLNVQTERLLNYYIIRNAIIKQKYFG